MKFCQKRVARFAPDPQGGASSPTPGPSKYVKNLRVPMHPWDVFKNAANPTWLDLLQVADEAGHIKEGRASGVS